MDPNETLRMLRLTIKQLRVDEDTDVWEAHANEICEYFEALDDWLSRGGFPPEEWREGPDLVPEDRGVRLYAHPDGNLHATPPFDPLGSPIPGVAGSFLPEDVDLWAER